MEKKTFEISHITNEDCYNALSIALNNVEQVSHMKIHKDYIMFNCIDIEPLLSVIQGIDKDVVVKEVIDGQKRQYDFAQRREREHYFMFRNMINEEDIIILINRISNDQRFKNVQYDNANRLLKLVSSQKDVLSLLRKELFKLNPSVEIIEHRKPVRSQDVFNQKYLMRYVRISALFVTIALAIITSKDNTIITPIMWMMTALLFAEIPIKEAWKNILHFKFFESVNLLIIALIMGVVAGAYVETCITIIIYQLGAPLMTRVLDYTLKKIDSTVQMPEKGIRLVNKDEEEEISLYEFEKGDILVVYPNQTIHMPGTVTKGVSKINTYSNTSTYDLIDVKRNSKVHSGDINVGEKPIYIKISKPYESSNYIELMNIASTALVHKSKFEKYIQLISKLYTPIMIGLGIFLGIVLPVIDYKEYSMFVHVGAVFMIIAIPLSSEQSTSLTILSGFAKAFESGIVIESSQGLDSINEAQTIVYDRFDGVEVTNEEFELFKKLSHIGRTLVIFNDGPIALEDDQYIIHNYLSVEEKLELMDTLVGPIVYIGDSFKDIALLQKSYVGISRGGVADSKVVESSDIVLIDSALNKVYETFVIARKMRSTVILNNIITILAKIGLLIGVISFTGLPLWLAVIVDWAISMLVVRMSTQVLE